MCFLLLSLIKVNKPLLSLSLIFNSYNIAKASTCVEIKSLMISLPLRFEVNNTSSNKGFTKKTVKDGNYRLLYSAITEE